MKAFFQTNVCRIFARYLKVQHLQTTQRNLLTCFVKNKRPADFLSLLPKNPYSYSNVRNYAKKGGKMQKGGKAKSSIILSDEELSDVINVEDYRSQLVQIRDKMKKDFMDHLSIRSAANAINNIQVNLDGEDYPLHELAQISKKNPNLIAINMIDFPDALKPAMQAIMESGSGLNPQQEGTMIYLTIPKLTREHRENLAKNAKSIFIKAKDEIRDVQNYFIKDAKKRTDISEDLIFSATNQIRSIADQSASELESIVKTKQKELLGEK